MSPPFPASIDSIMAAIIPAPSSVQRPNDSSSTPLVQNQAQRGRRLNREERKNILILRRMGYTYQAIAEHLRVSHRAVQYTCEANTCDPKRRPGRNSKLSSKQVDEVEAFLAASKENRNMSYKKVIEALDLGVKQDCLRRALQKRGYTRQITSTSKCEASKKRSQVTWEIYKDPDFKTKDESEPTGNSAAMSTVPEHPYVALGPALTHNHQPTAAQSHASISNSQSPFTRYPHTPTLYHSHSSAPLELHPVQSQSPSPYYHSMPSDFRYAQHPYSAAAFHHNHPIPPQLRPAHPRITPGPFHRRSASAGVPQYHPLHQGYQPITSNKLRPPLPEYRQALSEYCPSLVERRSISIQTPPPPSSLPNFDTFPFDPHNLSRSATMGLCQATEPHNQMIFEVSTISDRSRKSSGYSTPLTIPDDSSDSCQYGQDIPPDIAGIKSEPRLR
ncbi:hypothetical protein AJ79_04805 [Helicocarpus griseus UAMH5409]|uniref:Transposase IS30-like HTH domain-containing protein n=1 Tax=Helicocarpus griseus UAMH5409 TaxID=1447875 RepID=A0A2B7XSU3_9EURO|nr:hypothetical protein AJ79_04805 [Helicocarpus griseus UAMH5409]